jgi:hypothetical protein
MNRKLGFILVLVLFLLLGVSGCVEQDDIVEGTGMIVFNDFEGGFYGIEADEPVSNLSTRNLLPINLSEEFKEEGLRIWFKVKLRPDLASIYMWGVMVEIIEIQRLD